MEFGWDDDLIEFRDGLRAFIREHRTPALAEEIRRGRRDGLARDAATAGASEGATGPEASRFRDAMNRAGYTTMGWPVEYGGQGKGGLFAFLLNEELHYWDVPYVFNRLSIGSIPSGSSHRPAMPSCLRPTAGCWWPALQWPAPRPPASGCRSASSSRRWTST